MGFLLVIAALGTSLFLCSKLPDLTAPAVILFATSDVLATSCGRASSTVTTNRPTSQVDRGPVVTSWREGGALVPLRPRPRSRTIAQHDEIETLHEEPSARSMLLQPVLAGELPEQLATRAQ
jgi:hypothetical protein